jgi:hypothetical protein
MKSGFTNKGTHPKSKKDRKTIACFSIKIVGNFFVGKSPGNNRRESKGEECRKYVVKHQSNRNFV